jgi:glycosyltransferase involved in cell wall biosynthesis
VNKILFSVVIPTYKRKIKLQRAINSVLNQTYKNWEILIIDNNSKDGTDNMVKDYKNTNIKIFNIKNNGCIAKSRNLAITKARGKFIAFLDSDDYWFQNKLECCYKILTKNKKTKFIYHNMMINNKIFGLIYRGINYFRLVKSPVYDDLINNGPAFPTSSVVLDKKIFTKINMFSEEKDLITWEDYDAWIRFSKISNNFECINKILGSYTYDNENTLKINRQIFNINLFRKKYLVNEYKKQSNWYYYALFNCHLKEKNYKKAFQFLNKVNFKKLRVFSKLKLITYYLLSKFKFFL